MLFSSKPSILIVDDDESILRTFSHIFQRKGYSVTVAERGTEALEKLGVRCFDVALIDCCLPDMDGAKLFEYIGASSPATVKIMLTGKPLWDIEGVDMLFEKPIHPDALLSLIDNKLKERNIEH